MCHRGSIQWGLFSDRIFQLRKILSRASRGERGFTQKEWLQGGAAGADADADGDADAGCDKAMRGLLQSRLIGPSKVDAS